MSEQTVPVSEPGPTLGPPADNVAEDNLPRDVCLVVTRIELEAAKDADERQELEEKIAARRTVYTKLQALGLDLRVRTGTPKGKFEGKSFILIGVPTELLERTAEEIELPKKLRDVPEGFTGYGKYTAEDHGKFEPSNEGAFFSSLERQRMIYVCWAGRSCPRVI